MRRLAATLLVAMLAMATACAAEGKNDGEPTDATPKARPAATEPTPTSTAEISLVLRGDGIGEFDFGADPDGVIAGVSAVLGNPDRDTGDVDPFSEFGTCPGEHVRGVIWGGLTLLFGDASFEEFRPEGTDHFYWWSLTEAPPTLSTEEGVGRGTSVADLRNAFPGADISDNEVFGPSFATDVGISGTFTSIEDDGEVAALFGGSGCGE